jgi:zinc D-Ala-D-Ala dipeptidase
MKKHGFIPFAFEWWHYDFVGWENYPPLDIRFDSLARGAKNAGRIP